MDSSTFPPSSRRGQESGVFRPIAALGIVATAIVAGIGAGFLLYLLFLFDSVGLHAFDFHWAVRGLVGDYVVRGVALVIARKTMAALIGLVVALVTLAGGAIVYSWTLTAKPRSWFKLVVLPSIFLVAAVVLVLNHYEITRFLVFRLICYQIHDLC